MFSGIFSSTIFTIAIVRNAFPAFSDTIANSHSSLEHINTFLGINMSQEPGFGFTLAILIPILAGVTQFISVKVAQSGQNTEVDDDNPMAASMKMTMYIMPLMSAFIAISVPAGLGLYWVTSALFQCLQQVIINKYMDSVDINILVAKNKEKAAKKKAKGQKTFMERLMDTSAKADAAKEEIGNPSARKTIKQIASINTKKIAGPEGTGAEDYANLDSVDISKLGEIGKKAYLVSQYEKEHGHTRGGKK